MLCLRLMGVDESGGIVWTAAWDGACGSKAEAAVAAEVCSIWRRVKFGINTVSLRSVSVRSGDDIGQASVRRTEPILSGIEFAVRLRSQVS